MTQKNNPNEQVNFELDAMQKKLMEMLKDLPVSEDGEIEDDHEACGSGCSHKHR